VYSNELLAFTFQAVSDVIVWYSYFMRQAADIENNLTSTQRIIEYTKLDSEDLLEKEGDE